MPDEQSSVPQRVPYFYANIVHFTTGPFDITADFAVQQPEDLRSGRHVHRPVVRVAMSLAHAKSMLKVLADRIADYEQEYGIIPSPHYPVARHGSEDPQGE